VIAYTDASLDQDVDRLATPVDHPAESLVAAHEAPEVRALLALTDRVERHRSGEAPILPSELDYVGDYKEYIDGPFGSPAESRFSDGTYGVLYAGFTLDTATEEALYWLTRVFTDSRFAPGTLGRKQHLRFRLCGKMADLRRTSGGIQSLYDPNDYTVSRQWGGQIYADKREGIWYDSVRHSGGECAGVLVPRIVSHVRLLDRLEFTWNGSRFAEARTVRPL
jgi:RES domain